MHRKTVYVGRRLDVPLLLMPAAADDPIAGLRFFHRGRYHGDDLIPALRVAQVEIHFHLSDTGEVTMAFDEPRNRQMTVEIDHLRGWLHLRGDLFVGARRHNSPARDRDCLDLRSG